jgi:radical SAM superfamily enzyme YgiQ (UPF0313 family)
MKFAFINTPSQELERPPAAAAAISACAKDVGWDAKVFDFNLYLNDNLPSDTWSTVEEYWRCKRLELEPSIKAELYRHIDLFLAQIKEYQPDMIGVTVFTRMSVVCAYTIIEVIRKQFDCKIVIGGQGITAWPGSVFSVDKNTNANTVADMLLELNWIDYYVIGDAEDSFRELLKGNTDYHGINGRAFKPLESLENLPQPDYTGIEPSRYYYTTEPGLYITATRGCVRSCSFCNIPEIWPKFKSRSADNVIAEIIAGKKKYGVNLFHFTDSLLNGNMKIWREINQKLIESKERDPDLLPIKYLGQFICRTRMEQSEHDWELISRAGADLLVVGFESNSYHVRKHMGKNYTNADIDFHFKQSAKYGIKNVALMFIGYPVETLEDHEQNIEFLYRYQKYAKTGIIHMVRWGYTGMFIDHEKVESRGDVKLIIDPDFKKKFNNLPHGIRDIAYGFGWINELNPTLTLTERIRRRLELHEISVNLGWPQTRSREELQILYNIFSNLKNNNIGADDFDKLDNLLDFH